MTTTFTVEDVRREVKILRALSRHDNLVKFYDAYEDHDNVYVVMDRPFWARTESGIFRAVLKVDPSFDEALWPSLPSEARDFVKRLLNKDPRRRLIAAHALSEYSRPISKTRDHDHEDSLLSSSALPFHSCFSSSDELRSMESIPDLRDSMYMVIDGYPCVRLLNLSGKILFESWTREGICSGFRISNDSRFANNIGGVLVEAGAGTRKKLKGFSPAQKFPQAEFAPYSNISYQWNQIGSGIMWKAYDFPVFLLSESSRLTLQEAAMKNEKTKNGYTTNVAEFELVMQTTKAGSPHSESCLKEGTCLPLGGYSVCHSPISGLISLLAAVDALSRVDGLTNLSKQLVFLVPTGEAWGYLGSRRFLFELDLLSDAVTGLNSSLIETVIEIGSVGKGLNQEVSSATNDTLDALKRAQDSLKSENVSILSANPSNPGIPPSSLMAFLRKNPLTSGLY
ncbi:hypothetical protein LWI29_027262 [Acer saccharum]|uniref:Nicastrin n=1 Tax=Acer saccharum TaxID=4024 RepID=A0AA39SUZ1_ACESA|nr:hypothetical protein LWI29_027262 [Acer saccharum]